jgi:hypothetical protein
MALLKLEVMKCGGPLAAVIQTLSRHRRRTESDPKPTSMKVVHWHGLQWVGFARPLQSARSRQDECARRQLVHGGRPVVGCQEQAQ